MFEDEVIERANHTPWTSVGLMNFAKDMARNGSLEDEAIAEREGVDPRGFHTGINDFVLIVESRPGTASRLFFTVKWTGADGRRHQQSGEHLAQTLWRAAHTELKVADRVNRSIPPNEAAAANPSPAKLPAAAVSPPSIVEGT